MGFSKGSWALWSWIDIPDRNDPTQTYLRRLRIIRTPLFALYLHFIFLADNDRDPHDHPWDFVSFVIRGSYTERLYDRFNSIGRFRYKPMFLGEWTHGRFSFHRMTKEFAHRITSIEPGLVTLVLIGRETKEWGFWTEDGAFIPWFEYDRTSVDEIR
jgi:hypothetical protein